MGETKMKINLTGIDYRFDQDDNTTAVLVSFSGYDNSNSINATVELTSNDMTDGKSLDDLTKKQASAKAKEKIKAWFD